MRMMSFLGGVAVGIGGMYLLDPDQGGARRSRMRDQAIRGSSRIRRLVEESRGADRPVPLSISDPRQRWSAPAQRGADRPAPLSISDPRQRWSDPAEGENIQPVHEFSVPRRSLRRDPRLLTGVIGIATLAFAAQRLLASRPAPTPEDDGSAPDYVHSPHQESHEF